MKKDGNLFGFRPPPPGEETADVLLERGGVRIERIVSNLARTDWYDQAEDEWLVLLEGTAELEFEDATVSLRRGDTLLIPAHRRHRVAETSADALWLTVHINVLA